MCAVVAEQNEYIRETSALAIAFVIIRFCAMRYSCSAATNVELCTGIYANKFYGLFQLFSSSFFYSFNTEVFFLLLLYPLYMCVYSSAFVDTSSLLEADSIENGYSLCTWLFEFRQISHYFSISF